MFRPIICLIFPQQEQAHGGGSCKFICPQDKLLSFSNGVLAIGSHLLLRLLTNVEIYSGLGAVTPDLVRQHLRRDKNKEIKDIIYT